MTVREIFLLPTSLCGAIALGHPIGTTGAVLDRLERRDAKPALVTMCAAGGTAPAITIERV